MRREQHRQQAGQQGVLHDAAGKAHHAHARGPGGPDGQGREALRQLPVETGGQIFHGQTVAPGQHGGDQGRAVQL